MTKPQRVYELLLDHCTGKQPVENLLIGLVWTLCQSGDVTGLAMSPQIATRTLPWSGDLVGKPLNELAAGILAWEPYQATVAMAAINCCINSQPLAQSIALDNISANSNLAVFEHFLPQIQGKKVVVVGRYPGLERYQNLLQLTVLEQQPNNNDLPAAACEYVLTDADWVFLTASSLPNKTFPRLAELATHATTVLLGPTTPWLPELQMFGIDFLAGIEVCDAKQLYQIAAQGGGIKLFQHALRYRIARLTS